MRFALTLLLCLTLPAHAEGFLTRLLNKPVPGGVAVIDLGNDASAPTARYDGKPVLVLREDDQRWIAVVGIPLTVKAGQQTLEVNSQAQSFRVE
ncbi:MAG TPA: peptidase M23, partial [Pseudomonas sp.]|nr:peptidase M23 [Pseudomonas sp.]